MSNTKATSVKLKQLRDELRLQSHLFGMETKDRWNDLEKKWSKFSEDMEPTKQIIDESSTEVGTAAQLLMEELEMGYQKIKKSLKEKK